MKYLNQSIPTSAVGIGIRARTSGSYLKRIVSNSYERTIFNVQNIGLLNSRFFFMPLVVTDLWQLNSMRIKGVGL